MSVTQWNIERRDDGVLIVRIPSEERNGERLPDAVFSFRAGDPQYKLWEERWKAQHNNNNNHRGPDPTSAGNQS